MPPLAERLSIPESTSSPTNRWVVDSGRSAATEISVRLSDLLVVSNAARIERIFDVTLRPGCELPPAIYISSRIPFMPSWPLLPRPTLAPALEAPAHRTAPGIWQRGYFGDYRSSSAS